MVDIKSLNVGVMPKSKKLQQIPCTVVLHDKGGTVQRAGFQLPGDRLRLLHS